MTDTALRERIRKGMKREDVFRLIPEKSCRILDIGYGDGTLLLRLKMEKECTELYGIEVNPSAHASMEGLIDGNWNMYLGQDDNHLDDKYLGFFNYIIMHDVLEHVYDPWLLLSYLRRYTAKGAKLILVCPNAQYWQTIFSLLHGDFPYGLDGHFNEDHIRWFTPKSMIEMAMLAGLKVEECHLLLTSKISPNLMDFINKNTDGKVLEMPPKDIDHTGYINFFPPNLSNLTTDAGVDVLFKCESNKGYLSFYAVKMVLVSTVAHMEEELVKLTVGGMRTRRQNFLKKHGETYQNLLPKEWKAYIWNPG